MFKQESTATDSVEIVLDDQKITVPGDMSVAAALLAVGKITARISPTADEPRSPHCLMGICFECLMEIDGVQRQACVTEVREGMVIRRAINTDRGDER